MVVGVVAHDAVVVTALAHRRRAVLRLTAGVAAPIIIDALTGVLGGNTPHRVPLRREGGLSIRGGVRAGGGGRCLLLGGHVNPKVTARVLPKPVLDLLDRNV